MRDFFEDLKQKAPLLITVSLVLSLVLGGALTKSIVDAKAAGEEAVIIAAFSTLIGNITSFKFFSGIFADFATFLKITGFIFVGVFGVYFYAKYKSSQGSEYEGKENGSSQWGKGAEDYKHDSNGREILNKKEGFILSKTHYLSTKTY